MSLKVKINEWRRKLTKNSTYLLVKKSVCDSVDRYAVKKILVSRPNHRLGNQLLITPLIQEIENQFPNAAIYLFSKGNIAKVIFQEYDSIVHYYHLPKNHFSEIGKYIWVWLTIIFTRFDLCINCVSNSSSGRIATMLPRSKYKINHDFDYESWNIDPQTFKHIAIKPIIDLRIYFNFISELDKNIPKLNCKISLEESIAGKKIVENVKINKELKTICIFTNATGSKCYDEEWWRTFLAPIESNKTNYEIIELLPVENISRVNFKYPTIYSTDIREMAGIIENVAVFITADCGVMHLASATNTTTIGLFKFDNLNKYKPYGNSNFAIQTSNLTAEEVSYTILEHL